MTPGKAQWVLKRDLDKIQLTFVGQVVSELRGRDYKHSDRH